MEKTTIRSLGRVRELRNNEFMTFCSEVRDAIGQEGADAEHLDCEESFGAFCAALERYEQVIVVVGRSALTPQLDGLDRQRTDVFMGIMRTIRTGYRHYEAEAREAACGLRPVVNTYKGVHRKPLADKAGYMENFIADMRSEAHAPRVEVLGLTAWVDELERVHRLYMETDKRRAMENVWRHTGDSLKARQELLACYRGLARRLNALCVVYGPERYADLFRRLNNRLHDFEVTLAKRKGRAAAAAAREDAPDAAVPDAGTDASPEGENRALPEEPAGQLPDSRLS